MTKPDWLNYASKYVDPVTGRRIGGRKHKRPVERTTLSTPTKPLPITPRQKELLTEWQEVYAVMNEAAAQRFYNLADKYLADLRDIEGELGYTPTPPAQTENGAQ